MQGQVDLVDPGNFTDSIELNYSFHRLFTEQVDVLMSSLSRRERTVLRMRFGLEDGKSKTLKQAGEAIGRSKSTAWRVEKEALQKLRHPSVSKPLRDYLGQFLPNFLLDFK